MTQERTQKAVGSGVRLRRALLGGLLVAAPFAFSSLRFGDIATAPTLSTVGTPAFEVASGPLPRGESLNSADDNVSVHNRLSARQVAAAAPKRQMEARNPGDYSGRDIHHPDTRAMRLDRLVKTARLVATRDHRTPVVDPVVSHDSDIDTTIAVGGADEAVSDEPVVGYAAAAMGLVESVVLNGDGKAVTILGQTFLGVSSEALVSVGDYVVAASDDSGELALLMPIQDSYVPGASTVWVAGTVGAVDSDTGMFSIGNTDFDYTALLVRNPALSPGVGDAVDMFGVQPVIGGRVLLSITGSDAASITGSDGA